MIDRINTSVVGVWGDEWFVLDVGWFGDMQGQWSGCLDFVTAQGVIQ